MKKGSQQAMKVPIMTPRVLVALHSLDKLEGAFECWLMVLPVTAEVDDMLDFCLPSSLQLDRLISPVDLLSAFELRDLNWEASDI